MNDLQRFNYDAYSSQGVIERDSLLARDKADAVEQLIAAGKTPVSVNRQGDELSFGSSRKVSRTLLAQLLRQLSILFGAGTPMLQTLQLVADQQVDAKLRAMAGRLAASVAEGVPLHEALKMDPADVSAEVVAVVRAAELSGRLDQGLARVSAQLDRSEQALQKLRSALLYPAVLLVMSVLATVFVLAFVVPQFAPIFASQVDQLPAITRTILWLSNALVEHSLLVMLLVSAIVILCIQAFNSTRLRSGLATLLLKSARVRRLFISRWMSQMTSSLGMMLSTGIQLPEAVRLTGEAASSTILRRDLALVAQGVSEGGSLSRELAKTKWAPALLCQLIASAEANGELGRILESLSLWYDAQDGETLDRAIGLVGPLITVLLGALIALMIVGVLLGVLSVNELL